MHTTDYVELTSPVKETDSATAVAAANAAHLARLLTASAYPVPGN
jgi:hypothetical protein